jgi:hypothetical protein
MEQQAVLENGQPAVPHLVGVVEVGGLVPGAERDHCDRHRTTHEKRCHARSDQRHPNGTIDLVAMSGRVALRGRSRIVGEVLVGSSTAIPSPS